VTFISRKEPNVTTTIGNKPTSANSGWSAATLKSNCKKAGTGIVAGTDIVGVKKSARLADFAKSRRLIFFTFTQILNNDLIAITLPNAYAVNSSIPTIIPNPPNTQLSGEDAGAQNVIHILCGGASSEPTKWAASTACYTAPRSE
jgi:hypothetical protein